MGGDAVVEELMADKGCHDNRRLAQWAAWQVRTHIPERQQRIRRWTDKPADYEAAFRANRRRVCGDKGKRLQRRRSEECERSFAHVCETGGGRRSWLRGLVNATKAHVLRCSAFNPGLLLRKEGRPFSDWFCACGALQSLATNILRSVAIGSLPKTHTDRQDYHHFTINLVPTKHPFFDGLLAWLPPH